MRTQRTIGPGLMLMLVFCAWFLRAESEKGPQPPATARNGSKRLVDGMKGPGRFGIGLRSDFILPGISSHGKGLSSGVEIYYKLSKHVALQLTGGRFRHSVERDPAGWNQGSLTGMPVQLSLQGCWPITPRIIPYVSAGGGIRFNSFSVDADLTSAWNQVGFEIEEKIDNGVGWHFGIGSDFYLLKNIALNGEIRYSFFSAGGDWSIKEKNSGVSASGEVESCRLDFFSAGLGLRYLF